MNPEFLFVNLQYLMLLVLFVPVVAAGVVWTAGRAGAATARRVVRSDPM